jgi:hypothetical protein
MKLFLQAIGRKVATMRKVIPSESRQLCNAVHFGFCAVLTLFRLGGLWVIHHCH